MKNSIKNFPKFFLTILLLTSLISCISYRPILDSNDKYNRVGEKQAQSDADVCMKQADLYLKASKQRRVVKEGGRKAVMGSIVGGVFSLVAGGGLRGLGSGAAIGAGVGALAGSGGVAAEDKLSPDVIKQRFTTRCLANQGYEIIGWE